MIILYFLIGVLASFIGALPLGASNIAVINTTIKQNAKQAFKIALAAGVAEVVLSYYALHCNMVVRDFFDQNMWVQILIAIILIAVGVFLSFKKSKEKTSKKNKLTSSKYATGFLLGILNPPVLIYWIVAFAQLPGQSLQPLASILSASRRLNCERRISSAPRLNKCGLLTWQSISA